MPFCTTKQPPTIASEAANAALNLAYEAQNVAHLVRCKGEVALLQLLAGGQDEVLANAAGAVQTVCYQVSRVGGTCGVAAAASPRNKGKVCGLPRLFPGLRCLHANYEA